MRLCRGLPNPSLSAYPNRIVQYNLQCSVAAARGRRCRDAAVQKISVRDVKDLTLPALKRTSVTERSHTRLPKPSFPGPAGLCGMPPWTPSAA